jgi:hypothetical protein
MVFKSSTRFGFKGGIMRHLLVFGISLMSTSIGPVFAQGTAPVVDGASEPSEYATTVNKGGMTVSFTLTPDKIYAACVSPGGGWVSIGLGSGGMSGATMFVGYVDDSGKPVFAVKKWSWFALRDYKGVSPISWAVATSGGKTTLEIALKRNDFIRSGQSSLKYTYAYANGKDFKTKHVSHGSGNLPVN